LGAAAENLVGRFINRFATPLMTGLFVVSAVSGVALFFHWVPGAFHSMHVWLSMVLLLPFVLHVCRNWRSLLAYAKRGTLVVSLVASVLVAVPFAVSGTSGGGRGGNPAFRVTALMTQARIADLAPVLKITPDALISTLQQRGYQAQSADQTLDEVASASGKEGSEALFAVIPAH
jgi:hypothetical protein